jgi:hypothetical protein
MTTLDQDAVYQYMDGRDLLRAALQDRAQLLSELQALGKEAEGKDMAEMIPRFDIIRAQTLLFELSTLVERIDSLVVQINTYADRTGQAHIQLIERRSL